MTPAKYYFDSTPDICDTCDALAFYDALIVQIRIANNML